MSGNATDVRLSDGLKGRRWAAPAWLLLGAAGGLPLLSGPTARADVREANVADVWTAWHKLADDKPDFVAMGQMTVRQMQVQAQSERDAAAKSATAALQKQYDSFDPRTTQFTIRVNTGTSEYDEKAGGFHLSLFHDGQASVSPGGGSDQTPAGVGFLGVNPTIHFANAAQCEFLKCDRSHAGQQIRAVDLVLDPVCARYDLDFEIGHSGDNGDMPEQLFCQVRSVRALMTSLPGMNEGTGVVGEAAYPAAAGPTTAAADLAPTYADDLAVAAVWQKIAGKPNPDVEAAVKQSRPYVDANQFARPRVAAWLGSVLARNGDPVRLQQPLVFTFTEGPAFRELVYDMDRKGFKSGVGPLDFRSGYPYTNATGYWNNYQVVFTNLAVAEVVPMDPAEAEQLVQQHSIGSHGTAVTAVAESALPDTANATATAPKVVRFHITQVRLVAGAGMSGSGTTLVSKTYSPLAGPAKAVAATDAGLDPAKVDVRGGLRCGTTDSELIAAVNVIRPQRPPVTVGGSPLTFSLSLGERVVALVDQNHKVYQMTYDHRLKGDQTTSMANDLIEKYGKPLSDTATGETAPTDGSGGRSMEWVHSEGSGAQVSAHIEYGGGSGGGRRSLPNTMVEVIVRLPGKFDGLAPAGLTTGRR